MAVWLGWLVAILTLDQSSVLPCSPPTTGGRLQLKRRCAEKQKKHSDSIFRNRDSLGYFLLVSEEMSARLYVSARLHLCVHYRGALTKSFK